MSTAPIWISLAALVVSIGSLIVTGLNFRRDTARLKVIAEFFPDSSDGTPFIRVRMVNAGRRPVILRSVGGSNEEKWSATFIDHDDGGKRLEEHEHYERIIQRDDVWAFDHPEASEPFRFAEMWVEDSLGVRHPVPKSRELILKLIS